jgi:hypothetical protein
MVFYKQQQKKPQTARPEAKKINVCTDLWDCNYLPVNAGNA